jgi:hypothetical protein
MADPEAIKELLDNKYFLFGLVGVALILGQLVKRWMIRFQKKHQDRKII